MGGKACGRKEAGEARAYSKSLQQNIENGLPDTSKETAGSHGYGLQKQACSLRQKPAELYSQLKGKKSIAFL